MGIDQYAALTAVQGGSGIYTSNYYSRKLWNVRLSLQLGFTPTRIRSALRRSAATLRFELILIRMVLILLLILTLILIRSAATFRFELILIRMFVMEVKLTRCR